MLTLKINKPLTKIFLFVCLFSVNLSCDVERRIKDYSYTNEWYYDNDSRYQVYQTHNGKRYIIVLNKQQTKLKRKYLWKIN
jgi:hypothetical protein